MNAVNVKEKLYDVAAGFFSSASVIWAEQIGTKPKLPYVTLKMGDIIRTAFPALEAGERMYQCSTTAEINLYTQGHPLTDEVDATENCINTAASDLMDFANYVESDPVTDMLAEDGMGISLNPPVRDLTSLQNESRYRYRAMAEFTVTFVQEAFGKYSMGSMPLVPNDSGGGTKEMAEAQTEVIEEVEIEEVKIGGNGNEE